jgi:hypothetical protein
MQWRRCILTLVALLAAVVGLIGTATSARASSQVVYGPPTEGTKVMLGDTSIDGPGFWTSPSATPRAILAWTGTDAAHLLNLMTSTDGLHYSNKHTLGEASLWRPAVVFNESGRGGGYGNIYLAWTGTDKAHTLNLMTIAMPGFQITKKLTFWGDTSFTAPAVAVMNDQVNLVWSGTDAAHTLNLIPFSRFGQQLPKQTFWGWNSISRPDISFDAAKGALLMDWTGRNNRIYFAETNASAKWVMASTSPLVVQTNYAPSMHGFQASNMPVYWLAWNGVAEYAERHLVVQYTEAYPSWNDVGNTRTLSELAISGPEMGYVGVNRQVLITWTGTDPAHHMNVAVVFVRS